MARRTVDVVCTMGTRECAQELGLFLHSLRAFHPSLRLVVGCSSDILERPPAHSRLQSFLEDRNITWVPCLDVYGRIDRSVMERQRGVWYPSRHTDFMMEKANLMGLAMATTLTAQEASPVVAFIDCDVTFLGTLPTLASHSTVALSEHSIRQPDEWVFGKYNGGYVLAADPRVLLEWRKAAHTSRYFDQAALEAIASPTADVLPPQHNYGFWRMFQSASGDATTEVSRFSIKAQHNGSKRQRLVLCYDNLPLRSVHTHFFLAKEEARDVRLFNHLMKRWLTECTTGQLANEQYKRALEPLLQ